MSVYGVKFAQLRTDTAADAKCVIDLCLAVNKAYGRAAESHTDLAATALVIIDLEGSVCLDVFEKNARSSAYDYGRLTDSKLFLDNLFAFLEIIGINNSYTVDSDSSTKLLKRYSSSDIALEGLAGSRILLMTCHACDGVVENDRY